MSRALQSSIQSRSGSAGVLEYCVLCAAQLPLRVPRKGEHGQDWQCSGCGTLYHAVMRDDCPPETRGNVRLLGEPTLVTDSARALLTASGLAKSARPGPTNVRCRSESDLSRSLDEEIEAGTSLALPTQDAPFLDRLRQHGDTAYEAATVQRFLESHKAFATQIDGLFNSLDLGRGANIDTAGAITRELLDQSAEDPDLTTCLSLNSNQGAYPSHHSLRVGMLAMSIGVQMQLDQNTLLDLATGCILHDLGMQRMQQLRFESNRVFAHADYMEVAAHPLHTFELLRSSLDSVSSAARMVAYQIHERCNGTGYPRGRKSEQIHHLAKIAAVADTYVALVSPRPHRDGLMPYYAINKIIQDARDGLFDADVVRALLRCVGIFPIGSYVSIGDQLVGRVVRSNPGRYDRPIVELWRRDRLQSEPVVVNLSNYGNTPILPSVAPIQEAP